MTSFLQEFVENAKDELLSFANEKKHAGEITGFVDTGCYVLNAMISGSLFGGLPNNRSTAFAGDQGCGKTYLALGIVRNFLNSDPKAGVVYYDTEGSITTDMMEERGIDTKRVLMSEVLTIEDFRTKCKRLLEAYKAVPESKRTPLLIVLDSLGMLSSNKEVSDVEEGKDVRDMTKAGLIKGAFRVLTLLMAKLKVPLILTNHTYAVVGAYVPTKEMSGGCLIAGTKIQTPGGLVSIDELRTGDFVSTLFGDREIEQTFKFDNKDVYELTFDDGNVIRCSGEHRFLSNGKWISATDMLKSAQNMKSLNIPVEDITGNWDVLKQQIQENIFCFDEESEVA